MVEANSEQVFGSLLFFHVSTTNLPTTTTMISTITAVTRNCWSGACTGHRQTRSRSSNEEGVLAETRREKVAAAT